ncbi:MAG: hypothetical protein GAK28_03903 [Luteibacter sp.]|uniref:hypothetical protein n=1 Tax=Luteibacter sp. TaxID=1886636 RepID=UPI0013854848|nr:hypothetical protein [Luteibacter sp.]KAF1004526.1 MAG: hypothetical protein GAK28_03903 [Luteibacter sp.]
MLAKGRRLVMLACIALTGVHQDVFGQGVSRFDQLIAIERAASTAEATDRSSGLKITQAYERLYPFDRKSVSRMDGATAREGFDAAEVAAFYGSDSSYVDQMHAYLTRLETLHAASDRQYAKMQGIDVMHRRFKDAIAIARSHPVEGMQSVPRVEGWVDQGTSPSYLVPSDDRLSLHYANASLHGRQVIVIAHPLCHFSVNAMHAMEARGKATVEALKRMRWMTPPEMNLSLTAITGWNRDHPEAAMALATRLSDWPILDDWKTPTFYFMEDGKVVEKISGWPPVGGEERFYATFDQWTAGGSGQKHP